MRKVHLWCVLEYSVEAGLECSPDLATVSEPLLELLHGLPGSGKSLVIRWLRSYFEYVWQFIHGVHFIILAPMNSMATNVEGRTVHSWGEVGFIKGGQYISSGNKDPRDLDSMATKCQKMRFVLIDEVENLGALCLADLESNVTRGMPEEPYK